LKYGGLLKTGPSMWIVGIAAVLAGVALAGNDLRVSMRMTPKSPKPGGKVTYLVSVTHMGTSFMKNMFVEDIVPAEIENVEVAGPPEVRLSAVTPESWGTRFTWSTPGDTIQMGYGVTYSFTITGRLAKLTGPAVIKVPAPMKKAAAKRPSARKQAAKGSGKKG